MCRPGKAGRHILLCEITWPTASVRSAGAAPSLVEGGDRLNPAHLLQELVEQRRLPPRTELSLLEPTFIGGGPPAPERVEAAKIGAAERLPVTGSREGATAGAALRAFGHLEEA